MSIRERSEFLEWYEQKRHEVSDNKRSLESYCQSDVTVLRLACKTFSTLFRSIGNIEVFLESLSIASACNKMFRKNFLKPDTIGIIPPVRYTDGRMQSRKAMMWLVYEQNSEGNRRIRHGRNGKEYRLPELPNYSVDGFCEETGTVYEFMGCFWHGHTCLSFRDVTICNSEETLADRYEKTMIRLERITEAGYQVKVMWECDFDKILERHPALKLHPLVQVGPLRTRDALYGGRTEALKLHYKVNPEEERIEYTDVMSLYPYICKYFKFPVGHPTILNSDECRDVNSILAKEGIIKCQVLPPQNLYHPVLPYRSPAGRLLFPLCRTCALESQAECTHVSVEERSLIGTWVVDEIRKAVDMGYQVIQIYEFYEYEITQYNSETGEGGHFVEYINTFLKLKVEASGYPDHVVTEEDKDKYISDFFRSEGITLDKQSIVKNAAKRGLSKLCLNSFWGKLTECNNRPKSSIITDPNELYRFLSTPGIEVTNLLFASDEVVWISWRFREEEIVESLPHTNEVIGAYVTTGARLKLYSYLEQLGTRALYCDTDSVIYVTSKNEPPPIQCGDKVTQDVQTSTTNNLVDQDVQTTPVDYSLKALDIPTTHPVTPPLSPAVGIQTVKSSGSSKNTDEISDDVLSYVALVHQKGKRGLDLTYGVRFENNTNKIGNQPIYFKANNVVEVGDGDSKVLYKGTIGLYELLFKNQPTYYDEDDIIKYKDILYKSSAHKLDYSPTNLLNVNRSHKYKTIISRLFRVPKGEGLHTWKQVHPITHTLDYKYWDDPNELVNRLYLFIASRNDGHTGHENEIQEIIQELRDAKYIKKNNAVHNNRMYVTIAAYYEY